MPLGQVVVFDPWSPFVGLMFYADAMQEVWSITDAQADIIRTAVRSAIDVNEDEGDIMLLRGGLIRLAFHDCVGEKCDGCINMDLDDNAGKH